MRWLPWLVPLSWLLLSAPLPADPAGKSGPAAIPDLADFSGTLTLLEEIDCAAPPASAEFDDHPAGISKVETLLGKKARVLPPGRSWSYMSFTVGKECRLEAGRAYLLSIEYPEDAPRSLFALNRGCETQRGFHTGTSVGDQIGGYVNSNPESLQVPLSGAYEQWMQYFHLHHRYPDLYQPRDQGHRTRAPEDGFRVIIVHLDELQAPVSAGAACRKIRLYEVTRPAALEYESVPEGLPRRHVFWREEMSDNLVHYADKTEEWGVPDDKEWYEYKLKLMRFLGLRTFSKDLLEFGHCQGWEVRDTQWFVPSRQHVKDRWSEIVDLCEKYGVDVIPYYEYYGSTGPKGLGKQKRCVSLKGTSSYTGLHWLENFNADVTDPETLVDAKKLLDETLLRYRDRVKFPAVWLRARPSALPVSYSDRVLREFEKDEEVAEGSVTRGELREDASLMRKYRGWWFAQRREFLLALRDYVREKFGPSCDVLFTWDPTEPGWTLGGGTKYIVNDNPERWAGITKRMQEAGSWWFSRDLAACLKNEEYLEAMKTPRKNWGSDEWSNSSPEADPESYRGEEGVMLTHPVHRTFSLTARSLSAFRTEGGLAVVRHYCLNENAPDHKNLDKVPLGYFTADMERTGPFSMMVEARAMALGDPSYLGYLASNSWNHGFPRYARKFYANYLSLPALPSEIVPGAADGDNVVVRRLTSPDHGSWYTVVNLGYHARDVEVRLQDKGRITHAPTGASLGTAPGALKLAMHAFELVSLRVR